jgi:hypothetical protein
MRAMGALRRAGLRGSAIVFGASKGWLMLRGPDVSRLAFG